jgi:NADPH-dependent 2,4-dienoyl-CoA reductase/sulfur reductase-like enzyme
MRGQYRVGALMQAVATASAALLRGRPLRMAQVDTGGLGAPDICVLGGGFGGLYTALRLSKLDWGDAPRPRVTLVDQQERFVFLPMLYEVATGAASCWEVTPLG